MSNFRLYAKYYDLLYKEKDYKSEALYIEKLIKEHINREVATILNLGCGTGKHDFHFIENGYEITGVDFSEEMISQAKETLANNYPSAKSSLVVGDVRTFSTEIKYDAIISLFHVASYQTTNQDIFSMFATAKKHLKENGIFIFDCWYGPAVLTHRPEVRIKRLENDQISVTRIAEPQFHPNENVVTVNYEVNIVNKKDNTQEKIFEKHQMRYFFLPEMHDLLQRAGFNDVICEEWLTRLQPGFDSWNIVFICKNN